MKLKDIDGNQILVCYGSGNAREAHTAFEQTFFGLSDKAIDYALLKKTVKGKPLISNDWHFSLSHAENKFVFAIGKQHALGIDIEGLAYLSRCSQSHLEALAKRVYTDVELDIWYRNQHLQTFLQLWTLKEAYLKALGWGLGDYPNEIQAITCRDGKLCLSDTGFDAHIFPRPDGHYCSLVCKKGKKLLFASSKDTNQY